MGWRVRKKEAKPFAAMAVAELVTVGLNALYKAATLRGLSYFVFAAYSYLLGTLFLLPLPFLLPRRELPPFKMSVLYISVFSAMLGILNNVCAYKGIEYSSPALSSATSNLTPAFTFILASIFRMENLNLRSSTTLIKIIGTALSVSGALIAVLYKGPTILSSPSLSPSPLLNSPQNNWAIGGVLLVIQNLSASLWFIIQPDEPTVTLIYFIVKTIIALPICLVAEAKSSAWTPRPDTAFLTIFLSGLFGPSFTTLLHTWGLNLKGPLYISIFKPFSVAVAAAIGVMFLGDTLHLGSAIGAIILLVGFYAVIWGKAQEKEEEEDTLEATLGGKTPLLQTVEK